MKTRKEIEDILEEPIKKYEKSKNFWDKLFPYNHAQATHKVLILLQNSTIVELLLDIRDSLTQDK